MATSNNNIIYKGAFGSVMMGPMQVNCCPPLLPCPTISLLAPPYQFTTSWKPVKNYLSPLFEIVVRYFRKINITSVDYTSLIKC